MTASDGKLVPAAHMIDGGPSVLFDAVALLVAAPAVDDLSNEATARDFVADAFQHCKFIGYVSDAAPLLSAAGVADKLDDGTIELHGKSLGDFVKQLGKLRVWAREPGVRLGKASEPSKR